MLTIIARLFYYVKGYLLAFSERRGDKCYSEGGGISGASWDISE